MPTYQPYSLCLLYVYEIYGPSPKPISTPLLLYVSFEIHSCPTM